MAEINWVKSNFLQKVTELDFGSVFESDDFILMKVKVYDGRDTIRVVDLADGQLMDLDADTMVRPLHSRIDVWEVTA